MVDVPVDPFGLDLERRWTWSANDLDLGVDRIVRSWFGIGPGAHLRRCLHKQQHAAG